MVLVCCVSCDERTGYASVLMDEALRLIAPYSGALCGTAPALQQTDYR